MNADYFRKGRFVVGAYNSSLLGCEDTYDARGYSEIKHWVMGPNTVFKSASAAEALNPNPEPEIENPQPKNPKPHKLAQGDAENSQPADTLLPELEVRGLFCQGPQGAHS